MPAPLSDTLKTILLDFENKIKELYEKKDKAFSEVLTEKESPGGAAMTNQIDTRVELQAEGDKLRPKVTVLQECQKLLQKVNAAAENDKPFYLKELVDYLSGAIPQNQRSTGMGAAARLKSGFISFFINKVYPTLEKLENEIRRLYTNKALEQVALEIKKAASDKKAAAVKVVDTVAAAGTAAGNQPNEKQADIPPVVVASATAAAPLVKAVVVHPLLQSAEFKVAQEYINDEKRKHNYETEKHMLSATIQIKQATGATIETDPKLKALIQKRTALDFSFNNPKRLFLGIKDLLENHAPGNAAKPLEHEKRIKTACNDVIDSKAHHEGRLYGLTCEYFRDQSGTVDFGKVNGFMFNRHFRKTDGLAYPKAKSDKFCLKDYSKDLKDYSADYSVATGNSYAEAPAVSSVVTLPNNRF